jgi:hypothetical protein
MPASSFPKVKARADFSCGSVEFPITLSVPKGDRCPFWRHYLHLDGPIHTFPIIVLLFVFPQIALFLPHALMG